MLSPPTLTCLKLRCILQLMESHCLIFNIFFLVSENSVSYNRWHLRLDEI